MVLLYVKWACCFASSCPRVYLPDLFLPPSDVYGLTVVSMCVSVLKQCDSDALDDADMSPSLLAAGS